MRPSFAFVALLAPFAALAQNNASSGANSQSQSVQISTSFSQAISFDGNRQPHTISSPVTITVTPAPPTPSGNSSSNSTISGNSTASVGNSTSTKPTSTGPLPTAPTDVDGGGNGPHGAPSPGQTGAGGVFGPGDGYTANGAFTLECKAIIVSVAGMALGGLLLIL